jgi:hypothetical protein
MRTQAYIDVYGTVFLAMFAVVNGCMKHPQSQAQPQPAVPQQPIPDPVPNLSPEDYAAMSGFDASTAQTLREQVRNNDLEWRVTKLEREVRRLNQRTFGVTELRIGDDGQQPQTEEAP